MEKENSLAKQLLLHISTTMFLKDKCAFMGFLIVLESFLNIIFLLDEF